MISKTRYEISYKRAKVDKNYLTKVYANLKVKVLSWKRLLTI